MAQEQRWEIETNAGNSFTMVTIGGLGPIQALANAGLTMADIVSITQALPERQA